MFDDESLEIVSFFDGKFGRDESHGEKVLKVVYGSEKALGDELRPSESPSSI